MTYYVDIQNITKEPLPFTENELIYWATTALQSQIPDAEMTLRIVDLEEITQLNLTYRQLNKPTNVLAFPFENPVGVTLECPLIGDVIICSQVLTEEAKALNKPLIEHWAHIVMHGVLHLLGYDHMEVSEKNIMESLETHLLAKLGYDNPYNIEENNFEK